MKARSFRKNPTTFRMWRFTNQGGGYYATTPRSLPRIVIAPVVGFDGRRDTLFTTKLPAGITAAYDSVGISAWLTCKVKNISW